MAAVHGYYIGKSMADLPEISREYARDSMAPVDVDGKPDPLSLATIKKRIALMQPPSASTCLRSAMSANSISTARKRSR